MVYKTDSDKPYATATVTLFANDQMVGEGRFEKCTPNRVTLDGTFDIGSTQEPMSPTATTCHSNPWGKLNAVDIDLDQRLQNRLTGTHVA